MSQESASGTSAFVRGDLGTNLAGAPSGMEGMTSTAEPQRTEKGRRVLKYGGEWR